MRRRRRRAEALGLRYEGHLRGLSQPAQAGLDAAAGLKPSGCHYEGHLRGLSQPAQAGLVA